MSFAARLRQERLRRHLSQETLAEALGVSARTISRWEQGQGFPQAILRVRLSSYFGLSPEAFFDEPETLASLVQQDAEEPDEVFSPAAPVLPGDTEEPDEVFSPAASAFPEDDCREDVVSVSISQETKVSGRLISRQPFQRRNTLQGLGVLGLIVLALGEFLVVFQPLAVLSAPALKGPQTSSMLARAVSPDSIRLTEAANNDGSPSVSGTALASNNQGVYICWGGHVHLPAQCMDLKNDTFSSNQPISLWSSLSGNGLGWNISVQGKVTSIWPFTVSSLDTRYHGDTVAYFEKTTSAGHNGCVGAQLKPGLTWERCGRADTYWVISRYGYLVSVSHSDSIGTPVAAGVCDSRNGGLIGLGLENKLKQCLGPWTFL